VAIGSSQVTVFSREAVSVIGAPSR
jgi:hypothetical protein